MPLPLRPALEVCLAAPPATMTGAFPLPQPPYVPLLASLNNTRVQTINSTKIPFPKPGTIQSPIK